MENQWFSKHKIWSYFFFFNTLFGYSFWGINTVFFLFCINKDFFRYDWEFSVINECFLIWFIYKEFHVKDRLMFICLDIESLWNIMNGFSISSNINLGFIWRSYCWDYLWEITECFWFILLLMIHCFLSIICKFYSFFSRL